MILAHLRKITTNSSDQGNWHNLLILVKFQLITNSTISKSKVFSPFLLTFFRTWDFPFKEISTQRPLYHDISVSEKLNNTRQSLLKAQQTFNHNTSYSEADAKPLQMPINEGNIISKAQKQVSCIINLTNHSKVLIFVSEQKQ